MAGPFHLNPSILYQPAPHVATFNQVKDLSDLKIGLKSFECVHPVFHFQTGVYWAWFNDADAEVVSAVKKQLDVLVSRGAKIVDVKIPHLRTASLAHSITITSELVFGLEKFYFEV